MTPLEESMESDDEDYILGWANIYGLEDEDDEEDDEEEEIEEVDEKDQHDD